MHPSPDIGDFSATATRKAVLQTTLQHPLTLFPAAVGILGALGAALFNAPFFAVAAACGGFGLSVASWGVNFLLRDKIFAARYIAELQKRVEAQRDAVMTKLKSELQGALTVKGAREYIEQGAEQFRIIQERYKDLKTILTEKLSPGEITYGRYLGTAEQVYLSVLDNLQSLATLIKSISAIDADYAKGKIETLKKMDKLCQADERELETLEKRMRLREEQMDKVNMLLTDNERALTELDHAATAIACVKTARGGAAATDLDSALGELEELARRAQKYNV